MKKNDDFFPVLSMFNSLAKVISQGVQNPFDFTNQATLDIVDKDDHYLVKLNLAGFSKDEVKIKRCYDQLLITAEKKTKQEEETEKFYYKESGDQKVMRKIDLPLDADGSTIKAKMEDGFLKIVLQKLKGKQEEEVEIG